jgi:hypothetical protein
MGIIRRPAGQEKPSEAGVGSPRRWQPERPPTEDELRRVAELVDTADTSEKAVYPLFKRACLPGAASFAAALQAAVATMQRDALKSSTIREYIAIIVGGASKEGLLSREDRAAAARLLAAFERMAAHCVGRVQPLHDDGFLDEAIAGMIHQDVSDVLILMRSAGLRISDIARLCTHHVQTTGNMGYAFSFCTNNQSKNSTVFVKLLTEAK